MQTQVMFFFPLFWMRATFDEGLVNISVYTNPITIFINFIRLHYVFVCQHGHLVHLALNHKWDYICAKKFSLLPLACRAIINLLETHAKEWYEQTITLFLFSYRIGYNSRFRTIYVLSSWHLHVVINFPVWTSIDFNWFS